MKDFKKELCFVLALGAIINFEGNASRHYDGGDEGEESSYTSTSVERSSGSFLSSQHLVSEAGSRDIFIENARSLEQGLSLDQKKKQLSKRFSLMCLARDQSLSDTEVSLYSNQIIRQIGGNPVLSGVASKLYMMILEDRDPRIRTIFKMNLNNNELENFDFDNKSKVKYLSKIINRVNEAGGMDLDSYLVGTKACSAVMEASTNDDVFRDSSEKEDMTLRNLLNTRKKAAIGDYVLATGIAKSGFLTGLQKDYNKRFNSSDISEYNPRQVNKFAKSITDMCEHYQGNLIFKSALKKDLYKKEIWENLKGTKKERIFFFAEFNGLIQRMWGARVVAFDEIIIELKR